MVSSRSKIRSGVWATAPLIAALTACGGGATPSGNGLPAPNTAPAPNAGTVHIPDAAAFCAKLSVADINKVMDGAYVPAQPSGNSTELNCSYPVAGDVLGEPVEFTLRLDYACTDGQPASVDCVRNQTHAFTFDKQGGGQVNDIPGLGDQAFCSPQGGETVEVLKGWIMLTVDAGGGTCDQEQTLAGMLLPKLVG